MSELSIIRPIRTVQVTEAQDQLPALLDLVERGDSIRIVRNGRVVARIIPEAVRPGQDIRSALDAMWELRDGIGKMTMEQILSARDEGRN